MCVQAPQSDWSSGQSTVHVTLGWALAHSFVQLFLRREREIQRLNRLTSPGLLPIMNVLTIDALKRSAQIAYRTSAEGILDVGITERDLGLQFVAPCVRLIILRRRVVR